MVSADPFPAGQTGLYCIGVPFRGECSELGHPDALGALGPTADGASAGPGTSPPPSRPPAGPLSQPLDGPNEDSVTSLGWQLPATGGAAPGMWSPPRVAPLPARLPCRSPRACAFGSVHGVVAYGAGPDVILHPLLGSVCALHQGYYTRAVCRHAGDVRRLDVLEVGPHDALLGGSLIAVASVDSLGQAAVTLCRRRRFDPVDSACLMFTTRPEEDPGPGAGPDPAGLRVEPHSSRLLKVGSRRRGASSAGSSAEALSRAPSGDVLAPVAGSALDETPFFSPLNQPAPGASVADFGTGPPSTSASSALVTAVPHGGLAPEASPPAGGPATSRADSPGASGGSPVPPAAAAAAATVPSTTAPTAASAASPSALPGAAAGRKPDAPGPAASPSPDAPASPSVLRSPATPPPGEQPAPAPAPDDTDPVVDVRWFQGGWFFRPQRDPAMPLPQAGLLCEVLADRLDGSAGCPPPGLRDRVLAGMLPPEGTVMLVLVLLFRSGRLRKLLVPVLPAVWAPGGPGSQAKAPGLVAGPGLPAPSGPVPPGGPALSLDNAGPGKARTLWPEGTLLVVEMSSIKWLDEAPEDWAPYQQRIESLLREGPPGPGPGPGPGLPAADAPGPGRPRFASVDTLAAAGMGAGPDPGPGMAGASPPFAGRGLPARPGSEPVSETPSPVLAAGSAPGAPAAGRPGPAPGGSPTLLRSLSELTAGLGAGLGLGYDMAGLGASLAQGFRPATPPPATPAPGPGRPPGDGPPPADGLLPLRVERQLKRRRVQIVWKHSDTSAGRPADPAAGAALSGLMFRSSPPAAPHGPGPRSRSASVLHSAEEPPPRGLPALHTPRALIAAGLVSTGTGPRQTGVSVPVLSNGRSISLLSPNEGKLLFSQEMPWSMALVCALPNLGEWVRATCPDALAPGPEHEHPPEADPTGGRSRSSSASSLGLARAPGPREAPHALRTRSSTLPSEGPWAPGAATGDPPAPSSSPPTAGPPHAPAIPLLLVVNENAEVFVLGGATGPAPDTADPGPMPEPGSAASPPGRTRPGRSRPLLLRTLASLRLADKNDPLAVVHSATASWIASPIDDATPRLLVTVILCNGLCKVLVLASDKDYALYRSIWVPSTPEGSPPTEPLAGPPAGRRVHRSSSESSALSLIPTAGPEGLAAGSPPAGPHPATPGMRLTQTEPPEGSPLELSLDSCVGPAGEEALGTGPAAPGPGPPAILTTTTPPGHPAPGPGPRPLPATTPFTQTQARPASPARQRAISFARAIGLSAIMPLEPAEPPAPGPGPGRPRPVTRSATFPAPEMAPEQQPPTAGATSAEGSPTEAGPAGTAPGPEDPAPAPGPAKKPFAGLAVWAGGVLARAGMPGTAVAMVEAAGATALELDQHLGRDPGATAGPKPDGPGPTGPGSPPAGARSPGHPATGAPAASPAPDSPGPPVAVHQRLHDIAASVARAADMLDALRREQQALTTHMAAAARRDTAATQLTALLDRVIFGLILALAVLSTVHFRLAASPGEVIPLVG
ncbi:hypothetical protein H696_05343 [Fonticula alba]|uniref:Uncharacterized protein n=1 Tax=Fonticula alba TaxID=691883 RepID=A0A058Z1T8_FONAL|nr:hypothetical protein H696_05343 [Fonticula alba]KCV68091.1 hypothetical protein H696_05343 [Fonticula alba]|eukprot:XP_009497465.1 hypothetical protein H696_05343 [Fonticula alba]